MNQDEFLNQLRSTTLDGLKTLGLWINDAKNFATEQIPLFVQEYARWYVADGLIWMTFWLTCGGLALYFGYRLLKICEDDDSKIWTQLIRWVAFVACFGFACANAVHAAKGFFAPRLVVVEGIKHLVDTQR